MTWFYESGGQPVGPISETEFGRLAAAGTITPDTLVWRDGMAGWQAHASIVPSTAGPPAGAATADETAALVSAGSAAAVTCQNCGGSFSPGEVVNIAGVTVCARCKPMRLQMLQEGEVTMPGGLWRSGKTLVMTREAQLPERCVHCNTTADLKRVKRRLYWHHPAIYLTLLANILVYAVVALIVRKTAQVELSVCHTHVVRRRWWIALSWVLLLAVPACFGFLAVYKMNHAIWLLLPLLLLIAAVAASMWSRLVYARKIDEKHVRLGGVCPEFLKDLPDWPGP